MKGKRFGGGVVEGVALRGCGRLYYFKQRGVNKKGVGREKKKSLRPQRDYLRGGE